MKTNHMTKKFVLAALLLLLNVTGTYAQKLDGTWVAGTTFQNLVKKAMDEDSEMPNLGVNMTFKGSQFVPCFRITHGDEEMSIDMEVWAQGTCLRKGDKVNTFVDPSKAQLKVISLTTTDEDANVLLGTEAGRKLIYAALEEKVKEENLLQDLSPFWDLFKTFEVKAVTTNKLIIDVEGTELDFDRVADRKW